MKTPVLAPVVPVRLDAHGRAVAHIPGEATRATLDQGIASITSTRRGGALPGGAHVTGP